MKPIADIYVIREETWENKDEFNEILFPAGDKKQAKFNDFFCYLQIVDYLIAVLHASNNFEQAILSSENLSQFLIQLHQKVAHHLLLINIHIGGQKAGKFATVQPTVLVDKILQPTSVPVANIQQSFHEFCEQLIQMTRLIVKGNIATVVKAAAFALANIGRIHPFENGNGRLARLLMNSIIVYGGFAPIGFENKDIYYKMFNDYIISSNIQEISNTIFRKICARQQEIAKKPLEYIKNITNYRLPIDHDHDLNIEYFEEYKGILLFSLTKKGAVLLNEACLHHIANQQVNPRLKYFFNNVDHAAHLEAIEEYKKFKGF